jgi:hypothetical protein
MSKKVAVLIKDKERQYEGLRSSLGLLLEFHTVSMFVLDHEIELTEEYKDNMEFIDEMEGFRYSNVPANVEKYGFKAQTLEEIAMRLNEYDLIIPY